MLKIYTMDVSKYSDPEVFYRDYALVSQDRRDKINSFRFQKDKNLSLGAGILLRDALIAEGYSPDAEMLYADRGKPFLPDYPEFFFSLSHSGERAMCAVADRPVGCDVQQHEDLPGSANGRKSIADRYYSDSEKERNFYDVWALKESYLKAIGSGLGGDFRTALSESDENWELCLYGIEDSYSYASCMKKHLPFSDSRYRRKASVL